MTATYEAATCDLCGSADAERLATPRTGYIMRSDFMIVAGELVKVRCGRCGMVRNGGGLIDADLASYYGEHYAPDLSDHTFYRPDGPVPRSRVVADWIVAAAGADVWAAARTIAEVGAGAGHLLGEVSRRFPRARCIAVEPGAHAAALAAAKGLEVQDSIERVARGSCDLIVAIAVLEHVASPSAFLEAMRARLTPHGRLILVQPTQDVDSLDLLFADHLFHFGTAHVAGYAAKTRCCETFHSVGHPLMPNFSIHVWRPADLAAASPVWAGPPATTASIGALDRLQADMRRLDVTLHTLAADQRRVAAFGLHEAFAVAAAYSSLREFPLACGLDDVPALRAQMRFPVVTPEGAPSLGVTDALLTMNVIHYPVACRRLERLGIRPHPVLSA